MIAEVSSIDRSADTLSSTTIPANVTWVDDGSENGAWSIHPDKVSVNQNVELIVYSLTTESTPGVRFLPAPVLWISPSQPENFDTGTSEDGQQVFIADSNQAADDPEAFSFRLLVVYNDVTRISPDPTIINREPS